MSAANPTPKLGRGEKFIVGAMGAGIVIMLYWINAFINSGRLEFILTTSISSIWIFVISQGVVALMIFVTSVYFTVKQESTNRWESFVTSIGLPGTLFSLGAGTTFFG